VQPQIYKNKSNGVPKSKPNSYLYVRKCLLLLAQVTQTTSPVAGFLDTTGL